MLCRQEGRDGWLIASRKRLAMTSETLQLSALAKVYHNTREVELIEAAIRGGEARFSAAGAVVVETGAHTGGERRSVPVGARFVASVLA